MRDREMDTVCKSQKKNNQKHMLSTNYFLDWVKYTNVFVTMMYLLERKISGQELF